MAADFPAPPGTMPPTQLGDLPIEAVIRIISYTLPEGFESLALTCKDIHHLCTPFIARHNLLRMQFDSFRYCAMPIAVRADPLWRPIRNAFDLLNRIAAEPIVARYIRHANLNWDCHKPKFTVPPDVPDLDDGGPVLELLASSAHLRRAGLNYREFYTQFAEEYSESNPLRYSQHAASFVLTLLPNAKSLFLPWYWEPAKVSDKLLSVITADARRPQQNPTSLAQLTSLTADMRPPRGPIKSIDFIKLWPLLSLPEVRTFRADQLVAPAILTQDAEGRQLPFGLCKALEHAYMLCSCIDRSIMAQFLRATTCLETLVYYHCASTDDPNPAQWEICSFLHTIEHRAGSRLQRLYIQSPCPLIPGHLSMRRFTQLRELVLPLDIFECNISYTMQRIGKPDIDLTNDDIEILGLQLYNLIPASVVELTLLSPRVARHAKVLQVLFYEFSSRATLLPALKRIVLECQTPEDDSPGPEATYIAMCESLVSAIGPCGVEVYVEQEAVSAYTEWPGSENYDII